MFAFKMFLFLLWLLFVGPLCTYEFVLFLFSLDEEGRVKLLLVFLYLLIFPFCCLVGTGLLSSFEVCLLFSRSVQLLFVLLLVLFVESDDKQFQDYDPFEH